MENNDNNKKINTQGDALTSKYSIKQNTETTKFPNKESYEAARDKIKENPNKNVNYVFNTPNGVEEKIKKEQKKQTWEDAMARGLGLTDKDIQEEKARTLKEEARKKQDPYNVEKSYNMAEKQEKRAWDSRQNDFETFIHILNESPNLRQHFGLSSDFSREIKQDDWYLPTQDGDKVDIYDLYKGAVDSGKFKKILDEYFKRNPNEKEAYEATRKSIEDSNKKEAQQDYLNQINKINDILNNQFGREDLLTAEQKAKKEQLENQLNRLYEARKKSKNESLDVQGAIDQQAEETNKKTFTKDDEIKQKHEIYVNIMKEAMNKSTTPNFIKQKFASMVNMDPNELNAYLDTHPKTRQQLDMKGKIGGN